MIDIDTSSSLSMSSTVSTHTTTCKPKSRAGIIFNAIAFRMVFLFVGICLDYDPFLVKLKYTDIDYKVFSDAGLAMYNGGSPYERTTYRYPPLLAFLLIPDHITGLPIIGKMFFLLIDSYLCETIYQIIIHTQSQSKIVLASTCTGSSTGAGTSSQQKQIESFTKGKGEPKEIDVEVEEIVDLHARWWATVWALNPLSTLVCTRGNADSVSSCLILLTLLGVVQWKNISGKKSRIGTGILRLAGAGAVFGGAIHLRLYPVIYAPAFCLYLLTSSSGFTFKLSITYIKPVLVFFSSTLCIILLLGMLSYHLYGMQYLQQSVFYHVTGRGMLDFKHNFSVYFLDTYLRASATAVGANAYAHADAAGIAGIGVYNIDILHELHVLISSLVRSFAPQVILVTTVAYCLAHKNLCVCLLIQTMLFVAFNRVITAQYFVWYLCLLPVSVPAKVSCFLGFQSKEANTDINTNTNTNAPPLTKMHMYVVLLSAMAMFLTMCLWLYHAYLLEMLGIATFVELWVCGVLFHIAHVCAVIVILKVFM